jgi:hypothetical protein
VAVVAVAAVAVTNQALGKFAVVDVTGRRWRRWRIAVVAVGGVAVAADPLTGGQRPWRGRLAVYATRRRD